MQGKQTVKMPNPLNPLNWVQSAQDWFRKTERSSGFRPYLIFLLIHAGFAIAILSAFRDVEPLCNFIVFSLYVSFGGFVILFAIKCFQDPEFCRSERHIETVKRLELMEQKNDHSPTVINAAGVDIISNPERRQIPSQTNGGGQ